MVTPDTADKPTTNIKWSVCLTYKRTAPLTLDEPRSVSFRMKAIRFEFICLSIHRDEGGGRHTLTPHTTIIVLTMSSIVDLQTPSFILATLEMKKSLQLGRRNNRKPLLEA